MDLIKMNLIHRQQVFQSTPRPGFAWYWLYTFTGPDGKKYDNTRLTSLRARLRAVYPGVEIRGTWEPRSVCPG
jgi:hypothetical protein